MPFSVRKNGIFLIPYSYFFDGFCPIGGFMLTDHIISGGA